MCRWERVAIRSSMSSTTERVSVEEALRHIKPAVRALGAYTLRPYEPRIKLNQNESPYDVPAPLKARVLAIAAERPWNRYPPFVAQNFMSAVAEANDWPTDGILVANGSNELIQAVLAVVVGAGVSVVIPEPTFTLYRLMTEVNSGSVDSVPPRADLRFDVDAIIAAAQASSAAVVVLCSPNNPTGAALTEHEIRRVHDETGALVLLDHAYIEFGGYDARPLLPDHPRLVLLRTFSKAMSLAGLRAGYLLAHPELAREVNKAKLPYNINFFSEFAAAEVLLSRDLLQPQIREIRDERDRLYAGLAAIPGIDVYPSEANFVLFRVADHKRVFARLLDEYGILVRDVSGYPMLDSCLRVNAGTPEENAAFLAAVRTIVEDR